jgi:hypothetical protein
MLDMKNWPATATCCPQDQQIVEATLKVSAAGRIYQVWQGNTASRRAYLQLAGFQPCSAHSHDVRPVLEQELADSLRILALWNFQLS